MKELNAVECESLACETKHMHSAPYYSYIVCIVRHLVRGHVQALEAKIIMMNKLFVTSFNCEDLEFLYLVQYSSARISINLVLFTADQSIHPFSLKN